VLATPWPQTETACRDIQPAAGKIVIDCTNPLKAGADGLALEIGFDISGGERIASWCQGAAVFKTFNQTGFENMRSPQRYPVRPVMFVAGDDAARKPMVLKLVADCGFESVDAGPLRSSRLLEPLAMLWIALAFAGGRNPDFAFAITRPDK
jgi:predicted dinucleotide-binding enzyme